MLDKLARVATRIIEKSDAVYMYMLQHDRTAVYDSFQNPKHEVFFKNLETLKPCLGRPGSDHGRLFPAFLETQI